jgi:hypothetical protein
VLLAVLVLAGCGGAHTTKPTNKASRPVAQPVGRGIDFVFKGGSGTIQALSNKQTAVSVNLDAAAAKGAKAELDKGSCGARSALQVEKPLGAVHGRSSSWSVTASLSQLTASPLAFVVRSKAGKVLVCGQLHSA